jgi:hypothetical protein
MMDLRSMAAALGGTVQKGKRGLFVLCPGPGHSAEDRSLSVATSAIDPEGFVCSSFASDAWQDCREHIRVRLGLPAFGRERIQPQRERPATPVSAPMSDNSASAVRIWREVTHPDPRGTARAPSMPPPAFESSAFNWLTMPTLDAMTLTLQNRVLAIPLPRSVLMFVWFLICQT